MTSIILGILSAGPDAALAALVAIAAMSVSLSAQAASFGDVDPKKGQGFRIAHPPQGWAAP